MVEPIPPSTRPAITPFFPSRRILIFLSQLSPASKSSKPAFPLPSPPRCPSSHALSPSPWPSSVSLPRLSSSSWRASFPSSTLSHHDRRDITTLTTSLDLRKSLHTLRRRHWHLLDLNYLVLTALAFTCVWILPPAPLLKSVAIAASMLLLLVPVSRQFFLPSLPLWIYLLFFFSSRFIPTELRPSISVRVLPALEYVLYGVNFSSLMSAFTHPALDLIAWFPYGIGHFLAPIFCSLALFIFAAPGTTPTFARAFGWLGVIGVGLQVVFPCTPPWYQHDHGLEPARYGMPGSAAGLARIDAIFGVDIYTTSFATAPVPFGAFPSLHAADVVLEALFIATCFPRLRLPAALYVAWVCWATLYLGHHYAVDLVAGALLAILIFVLVRRFWLPQPQSDKRTRWEYDHVEIGRAHTALTDEERPVHKDTPWHPHPHPHQQLTSTQAPPTSSDSRWSAPPSDSRWSANWRLVHPTNDCEGKEMAAVI